MVEGGSMEIVRLSEKQIETYLGRIDYYGKRKADKWTLDELIYLHQCAIPFETIDMHHTDAAPSMNLEMVFDKLITQKRGGYCFELNFLFETLLTTLGFSARPVMCRAVRGRPGRMPINHRAIIVSLDNELYFADVGFGGPLPPGALHLKDGLEQTIREEQFTLRFIDNTWWAVQRKTQAKQDRYGDNGEERIQVELELCLAAVTHQDFDALNMYFSSRGSLFSETYLANKRHPEGFSALRNNVLTIRRNDAVVVRELQNEDDFAHVLEVYFGFTPPS
jgi:N-hydroxyarylamine O-acetyltransferase